MEKPGNWILILWRNPWKGISFVKKPEKPVKRNLKLWRSPVVRFSYCGEARFILDEETYLEVQLNEETCLRFIWRNLFGGSLRRRSLFGGSFDEETYQEGQLNEETCLRFIWNNLFGGSFDEETYQEGQLNEETCLRFIYKTCLEVQSDEETSWWLDRRRNLLEVHLEEEVFLWFI